MINISNRRLYLCVPARDDMATFLEAALRGGIDVVQLREKVRPIAAQLDLARRMVAICHDYGVPFIVNDSPELALEAGADGVHVGQDDLSVQHCRQLLGPHAIVGLSTHDRDEFARALNEDATYYSAGPIVPTPTKLGRPGTGVDYPLWCQAQSSKPIFVTGGVNETNVATLVKRGLRRFVVVRALHEADDVLARATALRRALDDALSDVDPANPAALPPSADPPEVGAPRFE